MFRVKADNADVAIAASITGAHDSEGHDIPSSDFEMGEITSDNPDAVSIVTDDEGNKSAHFGAPGVANLICPVTFLPNPALSFSLGAQVEVTTGDPVAVTGGITLEGLTEDTPVEPAPEA